MERKLFSVDEARAAERREGSTHPIVTVLNSLEGRIAPLVPGYWAFSINQQQRRDGYIKRNFGFLADAVAEIGDFPAGPLDLINVYSRVLELFPNYDRFFFAGIITSSYVCAGSGKPGWSNIPRFYLEHAGRLPRRVNNDAEGLEYMYSRLQEIDGSLDDLQYYVLGLEFPHITLEALVRAELAGDQSAKATLEEVAARQRERKTPATHFLSENLGKQIGCFKYYLINALHR